MFFGCASPKLTEYLLVGEDFSIAQIQPNMHNYCIVCSRVEVPVLADAAPAYHPLSPTQLCRLCRKRTPYICSGVCQQRLLCNSLTTTSDLGRECFFCRDSRPPTQKQKQQQCTCTAACNWLQRRAGSDPDPGPGPARLLHKYFRCDSCKAS